MSFLVVTPSELIFNFNNQIKLNVYMIYENQYIELGQNSLLGIGKTNPTDQIHVGNNMYLNRLKNITYTSPFSIQVANSPLSFVPVGTIVLWSVPTNIRVTFPMDEDVNIYLPNGWLVCDGRTLLVSEYPDLFLMLQYDYGGSGTNFSVPNFKGNSYGGFAVVNRLNTSYNLTNASFKVGRNTNDVNGNTIKLIKINANNLPNHYHLTSTTTAVNADNGHSHSLYPIHSGTGGGRGGSGGVTSGSGTTGSTTGTYCFYHNHSYNLPMNDPPGNGWTTASPVLINIEQKYIVMNYIIRVF